MTLSKIVDRDESHIAEFTRLETRMNKELQILTSTCDGLATAIRQFENEILEKYQTDFVVNNKGEIPARIYPKSYNYLVFMRVYSLFASSQFSLRLSIQTNIILNINCTQLRNKHRYGNFHNNNTTVSVREERMPNSRW